MSEPFDDVLRAHRTRVERTAWSVSLGVGGRLVLDGLISAGAVALWQAWQRYDPARSPDLWRFAFPIVRGAMLDEMRFTDHLSRDARHAVKTGNAERISWGLLYPCGLENAESVPHVLDPEKTCEASERESLARRAVESLLGSERRVAHEHFFEGRNLLDVAQELGVSESRACQLKKSAVEKMRRFVVTEGHVAGEVVEKGRKGKGMPRILLFRDREQTVSAWARELGMKPYHILARLKHGWSVERALTEPVRSPNSTSIRSSPEVALPGGAATSRQVGVRVSEEVRSDVGEKLLDDSDEVLRSVEKRHEELKRDVEDKRVDLERSEQRLAAFRTRTMSLLGVASSHKSGQTIRAERQAHVALLFEQGLTRAEIVRKTGLPDHLVGYDLSCMRRRRGERDEEDARGSTDEASTLASSASPVLTGGVGVEEDNSDSSSREPPSGTGESSDAGSEGENTEGDESGDPGATLRDLAAECSKRALKTKGLVFFKTTKDNGHIHIVGLTREGNGRTRVWIQDGHAHSVSSFDVLEAEDHTHGLTLEDATGFETDDEPAPYAASDPGKPGIVKPGCSVSKNALKELVRDFLQGKRQTLTFLTTEDDGHRHTADLDGVGDGETLADGTGHVHKIRKFELVEGGHDHSHGLTPEEGSS